MAVHERSHWLLKCEGQRPNCQAHQKNEVQQLVRKEELLGSFNALVEPENRVALSDYLIRDKYDHLVRVDNTLVSQGKKLFNNGTIEFKDETRTVVKLSSITSWWITLQDQTHYFGISTAHAAI